MYYIYPTQNIEYSLSEMTAPPSIIDKTLLNETLDAPTVQVNNQLNIDKTINLLPRWKRGEKGECGC